MPIGPREIDRAEQADLVTFPKGIGGAVCANCKFVDPEYDYCNHPKVDQKLKDGVTHMCCSYWDANGVKREWEELAKKHKRIIAQQ